MRKYTVFFDGGKAHCEVRERHGVRRLESVDCSDPDKPFLTSIYQHYPDWGWSVLAAALLWDASDKQERDLGVVQALASELEMAGPLPWTVTRAELAFFRKGWTWRDVLGASPDGTPADPDATEGGI